MKYLKEKEIKELDLSGVVAYLSSIQAHLTDSNKDLFQRMEAFDVDKVNSKLKKIDLQGISNDNDPIAQIYRDLHEATLKLNGMVIHEELVEMCIIRIGVLKHMITHEDFVFDDAVLEKIAKLSDECQNATDRCIYLSKRNGTRTCTTRFEF